jgi:Ni/Co efflux regulator RcnB
MMNRLVSSTLAAAMALSMAGSVQAATETKPKKEPTAAQLAARERMSKCSVEWKEAKAGGKLAKDAKWPKFWSECNTRLKGGTKA